jgi:hypothetical protein
MDDAWSHPTPTPKQATCCQNLNPYLKAHNHVPGLDNRWTMAEHNNQ